MEEDENPILKQIKESFENNKIISSFNYEIAKIEEDFNEYCLTLRHDDLELKGIFMNKQERVKENQIIKNSKFYIDKSNKEIKIYIVIFELNNPKENIKNTIKIDAIKVYNFKPENILTTIKELELFEEELNEENIFIVLEIKENKITLLDPIRSIKYYMNYKNTKDVMKIEKDKFIYLKYFLFDYKQIKINNLTFVQKADDFQIFSILDKKIKSSLTDFYDVNEVKEGYQNEM